MEDKLEFAFISFTGTSHCMRTGRLWQLGLVGAEIQCALSVLPEMPHPVCVPQAGMTGSTCLTPSTKVLFDDILRGRTMLLVRKGYI